jgi:hypothetical protein
VIVTTFCNHRRTSQRIVLAKLNDMGVPTMLCDLVYSKHNPSHGPEACR